MRARRLGESRDVAPLVGFCLVQPAEAREKETSVVQGIFVLRRDAQCAVVVGERGIRLPEVLETQRRGVEESRVAGQVREGLQRCGQGRLRVAGTTQHSYQRYMSFRTGRIDIAAARERRRGAGEVMQRMAACAKQKPALGVLLLGLELRLEERGGGLRATGLQLRERLRARQALLLLECRRADDVLAGDKIVDVIAQSGALGACAGKETTDQCIAAAGAGASGP